MMPTVIGAIFTHGPQGLIGTYGFAGSITVLSALILAQVYLIVARVQLDFRGAA